MALYRVWAKMTTYCYLDVDADSADEANEIAENTDGGDFIEDDSPYGGEWDILYEDTEKI